MSAQLAQERAGRLRQAMGQAGLDLLVVPGNAWRSDYLRFALDVTPMEGQAIACIARDGVSRVFVESPAEAARIAAEQPALDVSWSSTPFVETQAWLASSGAGKAGLVSAHATPLALARGPLGASVAATTAWFDRLMVNKSAAEADAVSRASALADAGYQVFRDAARVGRTEYELIADTESWFRAQGCPENFVILGSGGPEVRGMHPPGERRIAVGDLVTTELTPCVDGYYAQICRTLVVGPPSEVQLRAFAVYLEALEAGIAAVRPGATHGQVALAQNDVFRRHGLGDYVTSAYTRVRGHGVGLFVDGPHVLENVDLVLEPDMTLIVHPNTYHPEAGYIVLGDTVRVTGHGCEVLTATPRKLISVPA
jgi:Xaa-Pro dipeptidase